MKQLTPAQFDAMTPEQQYLYRLELVLHMQGRREERRRRYAEAQQEDKRIYRIQIGDDVIEYDYPAFEEDES